MDENNDSEADVTTRASISVKDRIEKLKNASLPVSIVKKINSSSMDPGAAESVSSMLSASSDNQDMKARELEKDHIIENLRRELADQSDKHQLELQEAVATHDALREQIRSLMETAAAAQAALTQSQADCAAAEEAALRSEQRHSEDARQNVVALQEQVAASREQIAFLEQRLADEECQEAASAEAVQLQEILAARDAELQASRAALQLIQEESVSLNASIAEAIAQNREREAEHRALLQRCSDLQGETSALETALARAAADRQEEGERRDREVAALREQLAARTTIAPAAHPHGGDGEEEEDAAATVSVDLSDLGEGPGNGVLSSSFIDYRTCVSELDRAVRKLRRIRSALLDCDSNGAGDGDGAEEGGPGERGERGAADSDPSAFSAPVLLRLLIESKVLYAVDIEREIRANFELSKKLL